MGTSTDELRREELRRDIESTRSDLGYTMDAIGDRVSPGRMMERRRNRMTNRVRDIRWRVMGTTEHVTGAISDTSSSAADTMRHAPEAVRSQTEGAPLAAGAIALGIGFLAGVMMPATEAEREMGSKLAEKAEPLREELSSTGQHLAETLKQEASTAAEDLKHEAAESAERVKETARHSG